MMSCYQRPELLLPPLNGINFQDGKVLEELISRLSDSSLESRGQRMMQTLSFCCVPTGCRGHLRNEEHPDALIRVVCSNPECTVGKWMHSDCFREWEHLMEICVKSFTGKTGKCRSDVQETRQGLEMALKACFCLCHRGYIRKDLGYYAAERRAAVANTPQKHSTKQSITPGGHGCHQPNQLQRQGHQTPVKNMTRTSHVLKFRDSPEKCSRNSSIQSLIGGQPGQVRERAFSFSSTGSSSTSSRATPPPPSSPRRSDTTYVSTPSSSPIPSPEGTIRSTTTAYGNIFRHRPDLSAFRNLPKTIQNPYHIKVEDEGPHGNDKIRGFLLTNLTRNHITEVHCAVCQCSLSIFDEFPLIDGTFFLSPRSYADRISVVFERRMVYLNAVCLGCLDGSKTRLHCVDCLTRWNGSTLVLGTMYSYDVFAAMACCRCRLTCNGCRQSIDDPSNLKFFSDFSRSIKCPHCHTEDFHFLKQLRDMFFIKTM